MQSAAHAIEHKTTPTQYIRQQQCTHIFMAHGGFSYNASTPRDPPPQAQAEPKPHSHATKQAGLLSASMTALLGLQLNGSAGTDIWQGYSHSGSESNRGFGAGSAGPNRELLKLIELQSLIVRWLLAASRLQAEPRLP